MRAAEAILGAVCCVAALLPFVQPFFLVPLPTAQHCWVVNPGSPHHGSAFFGYGGLENDHTFGVLYLLYALATAVSAFGVFLSGRMYITLLRTGDYRAKRYRTYLRALVAYFVAQMIINFGVAVSYVDNRCGYHNVDHRGTCSSSFGWNISIQSVDPPTDLLERIESATGINCTSDHCTSFGDDCCAPSSEPATCRNGHHPLEIVDIGCSGSSDGMYACCDVGGTFRSGCDPSKCTSYGGDCYACPWDGEPATCERGYEPMRWPDACTYTCCLPSNYMNTSWLNNFTAATVTALPSWEFPSAARTNPPTVYIGRFVYLLFTFLGGILTNVMLELVRCVRVWSN